MDFEKKSKEAGWSTNYRSLFKLWLYPTWSHNLPLEIMIGTNLNLPFLKKPKLSRKLQLFLPIDILRRTFKIIPSSYIYVLLFKLDPLSWPYSNPRDRDLNIPESNFLQVSVSIQKVFFFVKKNTCYFEKYQQFFLYFFLLFPWKRLIKTNFKTLPLRMSCVKLG